MMGKLPEQQNRLFYDFCLERHIPQTHLLRRIDHFLDFDSLRTYLKPYYSTVGRPSIDPELMLRMLIVGYCYGIRSERKLCEEIHFNLAYRWFCRLGLEDQVPDHSSFSKNRHGRYRESDLFRHLFDQVVKGCFDEGLIKGEGFAVDASLIHADVHNGRNEPNSEALELFDRETASRAVKEYLDAVDNDSLQGNSPKNLSLTDPQAGIAQNKGTRNYSYSTNYMVDVESHLIVDVEATPSNLWAEAQSTKSMLDRIQNNYGVTPKRIIGDTAYGTAAMLDWYVKKGISPHCSVRDQSKRKDGTYEKADFIYDKEKNEYLCPQNKRLHTTGKVDQHNQAYIFRASQYDCTDCVDKNKCCPNVSHRKLLRSIYEDARNIARAIHKTPAYAQSMNDRKKVEVLFGQLKNILKLERLRLRGLTGAHDEFLLAATAQNLRKMAKYYYPPPLLTG